MGKQSLNPYGVEVYRKIKPKALEVDRFLQELSKLKVSFEIQNKKGVDVMEASHNQDCGKQYRDELDCIFCKESEFCTRSEKTIMGTSATASKKNKPNPEINKPTEKNNEYCAIIVGHVGNEPEMRFTPTGVAVTNVSIGCYAGKDTDKEKLTQWIRLTFWKDAAEKAHSALTTGMKVRVSGNCPTISTWENKEKETQYRMEMTAWEFTIIPKPESSAK